MTESKRSKVAFLGPLGTYSHQAVIQQFGQDIDLLPQITIADCFNEIQNNNDVDYAVVPFENSSNGSVIFTYDLLRDWFHLQKYKIISNKEESFQSSSSISLHDQLYPNIIIIAEEFVSVHHCFITNSKSFSNIKKIYSHPQAWGQVLNFLENNPILKKSEKIDITSTSKGAELIKKYNNDETIAAIGSKMAAEVFNVPILKENIEDYSNNTTRFLVFAKKSRNNHIKHVNDQQNLKTNPLVTMMSFTIENDNPGSLCDALKVFKDNNVNLTSITSRPSKTEAWRYVFFVEFVHEDSIQLVSTNGCITKELKPFCKEIFVYGNFKRGNGYWKANT